MGRIPRLVLVTIVATLGLATAADARGVLEYQDLEGSAVPDLLRRGRGQQPASEQGGQRLARLVPGGPAARPAPAGMRGPGLRLRLLRDPGRRHHPLRRRGRRLVLRLRRASPTASSVVMAGGGGNDTLGTPGATRPASSPATTATTGSSRGRGTTRSRVDGGNDNMEAGEGTDSLLGGDGDDKLNGDGYASRRRRT